MRIKKFFEYNTELPYEEINYIDFYKIETDNIKMLEKISEFMCKEYNLIKMSFFLGESYLTFDKFRHYNLSLRYYDDYIYIKIEIGGGYGLPVAYKCDKLSGFKKFLKNKSYELITGFNKFTKKEELPKKKGFFDFLKRKK